MKPWPTTRSFLTWLCVHPAENATSRSKKLFYKVVTLLIFANFFFNFVSSVMFFEKFVQINLVEALHALLQITGFFSYLYLAISTYFLRFKVNKILDMSEDLYSASMNLHQFKWIKSSSQIRISNFRCKRRFIPIFGRSKQQKRMDVGMGVQNYENHSCLFFRGIGIVSTVLLVWSWQFRWVRIFPSFPTCVSESSLHSWYQVISFIT